MKQIKTSFLLFTILLSFTACTEKEFETTKSQLEINTQATVVHMLIYQLGTGGWQEMPCDSETFRTSLERLVWLSVAEGVTVSVYDKFPNPTGNPPAYMPEKIETTDREKFLDFGVYWLERGYEIIWTYDPDTKTYRGEARPQEK